MSHPKIQTVLLSVNSSGTVVFEPASVSVHQKHYASGGTIVYETKDGSKSIIGVNISPNTGVLTASSIPPGGASEVTVTDSCKDTQQSTYTLTFTLSETVQGKLRQDPGSTQVENVP
jgi:hypothetical protein